MGASDANPTKSMAHAATGQTRLKMATLAKPDTVVKLPNGEQLILLRPQAERMPVFQKFNPKRYDPSSGKPYGKSPKDGKAAFSKAGKVPFTKFLLTAFVMHQLVGLARGWWQRWRQRQARQLAEVDQDEWEEEEETAPDVAAADARLRQALLPAMMRAAMPKPNNRSKAHQQAQAHRTRARHTTTAGQMMRPGQNVKQRQPGMLGRLDKAMRQQVRDLAIAQEQAHQLQLEAVKRTLQLQGIPNPPAPRLTAGPEGGDSMLVQAAGQQQPSRIVMQAAAQPVKKR